MDSAPARRLLLLTFSSLALCLADSAQAQGDQQWACRQDGQGGWSCTPAAGQDEANAPPSRPAQAADETPARTRPEPESKSESGAKLTASADTRSDYPPAGPGACGPPQAAPDLDVEQRHREDQPSVARADQMFYRGDTGTYTFVGDVFLERWDQQLAADRLVYVEPTGRVEAQGNFRYQDPGLAVEGTEGYFLLDEDKGELEQARYRLRSSHAHGDADRVVVESAQKARYRRVSYTTCPVGEEDWWLRASTLVTDRESGVGTAYNARLAFLGVPLLYTPYISFPIDDRRKSGFLAPRISHSAEEGLDFSAPYYWNIAPAYDATLTPRYIRARGLMLGTEFRYLRPSFQGTTNFTYLPNDDLFGDDRWAFSWEQRQQIAPGASARAEVNRISDEKYLSDFGNDLTVASTTHLESELVTDWRLGQWAFTGQLQTWQTVPERIAERNYPYRRLPRLNALYRSRPGDSLLEYSLNGELTQFVHPAEDLRDTGTRLALNPRLSLPVRRMAYFVEPALGLRHTSYRLDRPNDAAPESPQVTVPVFSLDSGIFLEREFELLGRSLQQTLEPRLFYLYVPTEDQDELPNFDTGLSALTMSRMFSEDRFSGPDRVGDANQFTFGLTSRFINLETGREYLRLGAAQIHYLDEREITRTAGAQPTLEDRRGTSDILVELRSELGAGFVAQANYQWDPYDDRSETGGLRMTYAPNPASIASLSYRQRRNARGERSVEQADAGLVWPVANRWRLLARWNYSLLEQTTLEQALGFEYRNCCWALRVLGQRVLEADATAAASAVDELEYDNSVMIQLEFTGITDLGDAVDDYLRESIYGYREL